MLSKHGERTPIKVLTIRSLPSCSGGLILNWVDLLCLTVECDPVSLWRICATVGRNLGIL